MTPNIHAFALCAKHGMSLDKGYDCLGITDHGKVGYIVYAEDQDLEEAVLPDGFKPNGFVRIELVDRDATRAWSNPVFVQS